MNHLEETISAGQKWTKSSLKIGVFVPTQGNGTLKVNQMYRKFWKIVQYFPQSDRGCVGSQSQYNQNYLLKQIFSIAKALVIIFFLFPNIDLLLVIWGLVQYTSHCNHSEITELYNESSCTFERFTVHCKAPRGLSP